MLISYYRSAVYDFFHKRYCMYYKKLFRLNQMSHSNEMCKLNGGYEGHYSSQIYNVYYYVFI